MPDCQCQIEMSDVQKNIVQLLGEREDTFASPTFHIGYLKIAEQAINMLLKLKNMTYLLVID